ncbi:MAG: IS5/IS1182 family transposase, partial [Paracoccaceae bacterium]
MSSWTPTGYATKNWATFNRALKQRGSLLLWFDAALS